MTGSGTQADPYIISTPSDLDSIRNSSSFNYYELANDIDLSSWGNWTPIGDFVGQLDGKGYKILNMTITGSNYVGFFGSITVTTSNNFIVKNLGFENATVNATSSISGILGGYLNIVGGLIENCYSTGQVNGYSYASGFIGRVNNTTVVKNCYSTANVDASSSNAAGFIAVIYNDTTTVENCYSTGQVTANDDSAYGFDFYSSNANVINCFWDINTSGVTTSTHATGLTTAQMKTQSSYTNWDFTSVWGINGDYPYLQVFGTPAPSAKIESRTVTSYANNINASTIINKKVLKNVSSYVSSIVSDANSITQVGIIESRTVNSYTLPIESNISTQQKKSRTVTLKSYALPVVSNIQVQNIKHLTIQVKSYANKITTSNLIAKRAFFNLSSYSNIIYTSSILPYFNVSAYNSYKINPSNTSAVNNLSSTSTIENRSHLEVV